MDVPYIEVTTTAGGTIETPFGATNAPATVTTVHKTLTFDDVTVEAVKQRLGINGAQPAVPLTAPQLAAQYSIGELAQALTIATQGK